MNKLKRYLITGFIVVVPVFLTLYILIVLFRFVDGLLGRFLTAYLQRVLGFYIPGIGLVLFLAIIILAGFSATWFVGHKIFRRLERWFANLPLINKIYPTAKQIVLFMLAQKELGFKKVVLIEYPSKGIWSLGFITNEEYEKISRVMNQEMVSVFVPTTPSPLTGYVVFVAKESLKFLDIPLSDALKIIISGGVVKSGE